MPYEFKTQQAGDLILSEAWNAMGQEILRLGAAKVDREGNDAINGPLGIKGNVEVGSTNAGASLRVLKKQEDGSDATGHGALVLGTDAASSPSLRLGYSGTAGWVQSQGAQQALAINPAGGSVGVGTDKPKSRLSVAGSLGVGATYAGANAAPDNGLIVEGNVGIGTPAPGSRLHVEGGALSFGSNTRQMINLWSTQYGIGVQSGTQYYRTNGSFAWFRGGAHSDAALTPGEGGVGLMSITGDNVGIGTLAPTHRLHVVTGDAVGLFESTGNQAYLRVSTKDGLDNRVELCNRGGGRLALWTREGGDAFNITKAGDVGIGTTTPRSGIDLSARVMTGAPNDYEKAQFTLSGGGTVSWGGPGGRLKWTQRFIAISMGRPTAFPSGHVNVTMPTGDLPAEAVWDGKPRSANAQGVLLGHWEALWAVHEVGKNENTVSYRITNYTKDHVVPSNWLLVGVVNSDNGSMKLGTGEIVQFNRSNPLRHRMYPADPIVYPDIFQARDAGVIAKMGNPNYDDTTYHAGNQWFARTIIRYGGDNEADGNGARVTIPDGYDTVWVRVLGDRWATMHAYFLDGAKEDLGLWVGGLRSTNNYCPDGSLSDGYNHSSHGLPEGWDPRNPRIELHQWVPIPAGRSGSLALVAKPNTNWHFWVSGVAFSRNPWAHAGQGCVAYTWKLNGGTALEWHSHEWNQDTLARIVPNKESELIVPVVPTGRDKLFYIIEHNNNWNGVGHTGITVNGTAVERLLATYDNPFARHWSSKMYERYIAARVPANVVGTNRWLKVRIDRSKQGEHMFIREAGSHDMELPPIT